MRRVFVGLAGLLLLALVAQFFLAAVGGFDTAPREESFEPHRLLGRLLFVLSLLLIGVAALARAPGRLVGLTALVAGLGVLQSLIRVLAGAFEDAGGGSATAGTVVFGLHAVNGLVMWGVARTVLQQARRLAGGEPAVPAGSSRAAGGAREVAAP